MIRALRRPTTAPSLRCGATLRAPLRPRRAPRAVPPPRAAACDSGIDARLPARPSPALYSAELAPTLAAERSWGAWDFTALWLGLVVCVPSW
jgi:hypothetical protein